MPTSSLHRASGPGPAPVGDAAYQNLRVGNMRFGKPRAEHEQSGLTKDRTTTA
jgi:hypothetical protein